MSTPNSPIPVRVFVITIVACALVIAGLGYKVMYTDSKARWDTVCWRDGEKDPLIKAQTTEEPTVSDGVLRLQTDDGREAFVTIASVTCAVQPVAVEKAPSTSPAPPANPPPPGSAPPVNTPAVDAGPVVPAPPANTAVTPPGSLPIPKLK